ncbi:SIR2 family protein [Actinomadura fulvescens]|uniref:SIR2-like domain-containing protein n=1 Tax=Actinomadura fulvescens TaxID=46160 RepID=A0ABN3PPM3_9ACTN
MEDGDWQRLIDQLSNGDCTPFLGAGACHGTLPSGADLSTTWAASCDYPFTDTFDLARVMQYAAFTHGDAVYVKQLICRELESAAPPDFSSPIEPHALLAGFPLPVFITTNYDDYLAKALEEAGKQPRVALCPWSDHGVYDSELFDAVNELDDDPDRPLVYHLHGSWSKPHSLVLTERDYLEFLVNVAAAKNNDDRRLVPGPVLTALTSRPLLFIGYSLRDLTFLVLFYGLLRDIPGIHRRRNVSVQLPPPTNGASAGAAERAKNFMTSYFAEWNISIFWGSAAEFCAELRSRMGKTA